MAKMIVEFEKFALDTSDMSIEELSNAISQFKEVRRRKIEAQHAIQNLSDLIAQVRSHGFDFCCRDTGEVLDPKYWVLSDIQYNHIYDSQEGEE